MTDNGIQFDQRCIFLLGHQQAMSIGGLKHDPACTPEKSQLGTESIVGASLSVSSSGYQPAVTHVVNPEGTEKDALGGSAHCSGVTMYSWHANGHSVYGAGCIYQLGRGLNCTAPSGGMFKHP